MSDVEIGSLSDRRRIKALEAQIADLDARLAEAKSVAVPTLAKKLGNKCLHNTRYTVDEHKPEVTCNGCGSVMDAHFVLRKIAHREVNFCYQLNHLRKETETLTAEVEKLKRARANLKRGAKRSEGQP
jgi:hypothetical protein